MKTTEFRARRTLHE